MEPTLKNYPVLLKDINEILQETKTLAQKELSQIITNGYWKLGKRLSDENIDKTIETSVLTELSNDLNFDITTLRRSIKFFQMWPQNPPTNEFPQLTWSHYKILLKVNDEQIRLFYLNEAQNRSWNVRFLSQKIKERDLMIGQENQSSENLLARKEDTIHVYKAHLDYVVDGDTLVINLDLGFDVWVKKRLRLRGINTPELSSDDLTSMDDAIKAKSFIEERIEDQSVIVVQTHKVDLHGRFVADVFYLPGEKDKVRIFKEGLFLNQELLDAGLAEVY